MAWHRGVGPKCVAGAGDRPLPPLLFAVGSAEALLDDTMRFARAASAAGTRVSVDVYEAMPHAFQVTVLSDDNPTGRTLLDRIARWVAAASPASAHQP